MTAINSCIEIDLTGQVVSDSIGTKMYSGQSKLPLGVFMLVLEEFRLGMLEDRHVAFGRVLALGESKLGLGESKLGQGESKLGLGESKLDLHPFTSLSHFFLNTSLPIYLFTPLFILLFSSLLPQTSLTFSFAFSPHPSSFSLSPPLPFSHPYPPRHTGVGGQVDFLRGATLSHDGLGKPILAMPSVTSKGISKIVPFVKEGE